jgi:hypothetical protein
MIIKLAGALPDDEKNGLIDAEKLLGEGQRKTFLVVALMSGFENKLNLDKDQTTMTLRVRHAEIVPEDQRGIVAEVLFQALSARTGAMILPYEPGEEFAPGEPNEDGDA